jgi:hypothetical protein
MTGNRLVMGVAGFGAVCALFLFFGFNNVGGLMAALQLCLLVGAPVAVALREELKSWLVVAAVSVVLSIGLTAISVQFLIWFEVATAAALVAMTTAYSVAVALLMSSVGVGRTRASLRESAPAVRQSAVPGTGAAE